MVLLESKCNCLEVSSKTSLVAQIVKNLPAVGRPGFNSWVGNNPWRSEWQPTSVFLPEKSHGQRSLASYSLWGRKELDMTEDLSYTHGILNQQFPMFIPRVKIQVSGLSNDKQ